MLIYIKYRVHKKNLSMFFFTGHPTKIFTKDNYSFFHVTDTGATFINVPLSSLANKIVNKSTF